MFFFALQTEDVEKSLAVVCSLTYDTPARIPFCQIVLKEQEDKIEEDKFLIIKQEGNKFLKVQFLNSQGNEADLSLKTNRNEGENS